MHLGLPEILFVLAILVLLFGAKKIPELGDAIGKGIRSFKKSIRDDDAIDVTPRKNGPEQIGPGAPQAPVETKAAVAESKKA